MFVRIRRKRKLVALSATLVAVPAGCAREYVDSQEPVARTTAQVLAAVSKNPGSGRLELSGAPGAFTIQLMDSTTDEFVRVGETLRVTIPAWLLWEELYPSNPLPSDVVLKKLTAKVKVAFLDRGHVLRTDTLQLESWTGTQYGLEGYSTEFVIPPKTDALTFSVVARDAANPAVEATIAKADLQSVWVFGGELPQKTLLFDNSGGTLRERVIESGAIVKGSKVLLGYTDWRADQVVDKPTLNTQIGVATMSGRGGPYQAPIYGQLVYQVLYGASLDGGQTFQAEVDLAGTTTSKILGPNRTDYEATQAIAPTAAQLQMYVHIKATLIADYAAYSNITAKWYADNQHVLLKEAWDNPNGPGTNYVIPTE
jgi:hypothetical protein